MLDPDRKDQKITELEQEITRLWAKIRLLEDKIEHTNMYLAREHSYGDLR